MTYRLASARSVFALVLGVPLALAMAAPTTALPPHGPASTAASTAAVSAQGHGAGPRPRYAPYFETWTKDKLPAVASASGARTLTLAFLQTPQTRLVLR